MLNWGAVTGASTGAVTGAGAGAGTGASTGAATGAGAGAGTGAVLVVPHWYPPITEEHDSPAAHRSSLSQVWQAPRVSGAVKSLQISEKILMGVV